MPVRSRGTAATLAVVMVLGACRADPGGPRGPEWLAEPAEVSTVARPGEQRKLIEFGWGVPEPNFVRTNIARMEQRPFQGVVLRPSGETRIFTSTPNAQEPYRQDQQDLANTEFNRFTDNFLLVHAGTDQGWDWFDDDDWTATERNLHNVARTVAAGGLKGIAFDPEPYGNSPWIYGEQPRAGERSFGEYQRQVRLRGAQFVRTLETTAPGLDVLSLFLVGSGISLETLRSPGADLPARLAEREWLGLLPAFVNGMLDGLSEDARLIDGNERGYYAQEARDYDEDRARIEQLALRFIDGTNRARYHRQVEVGHGIYVDGAMNLWESPEYFGFCLSDDEERLQLLEHNTYHALRTTDEYVWIYGEHVDWWRDAVPRGVEDAIRRAAEKAASGQPLGIDISQAVQAGRTRCAAFDLSIPG